MLQRTIRFIVVGVAAAAVAVSAVAVPGTAAAVAAPAFTPSPFRGGTVAGDVTGDGVADRVTIGYLGDRDDRACAAQLRAGLGRGVFAAPAVVALPVRGNTVLGCPDLATLLAGATPAANRLAVGFYYWPPNDAGYVQAFGLVGGTARFKGELPAAIAQLEPTAIGSQDFDGDGRGDLWEQTDKGNGFDAFLSTGSTFRPLTSLQGATVSVQFADLNHRRGTDLLLSNVRPFRSEPSAVVVDGLTGATQRLAFGAALPDGAYVDTYQLSIVDLDHNGYPDLRVDAVGNVDSGNVVGTTYFVNKSSGGRWYFAPQALGRPGW